MGSLGSVKFKMHRWVNYIFYAGIFGAGFIAGSGLKLMNVPDTINKLLLVLKS